MRATFFGTRGSLPVPGAQTLRYGGNTSCVFVETDRSTTIVLDMGSGAYPLGQQLIGSTTPPRGHILITHTHWDHIQGFPFFAPFFRPGSEWDIYAPRTLGPSLRQALSGQMQHTYFPLELEQFAATIRYHDLVEGRFVIDDVTIDTHYLNHTALILGYRLQADGTSLVYALDHEPYSPDWATGIGTLTAADQRHIDFVAGADLLIHDVQYTADEYASKIGWGHSPVDYAITVAGRRLLGGWSCPITTRNEPMALSTVLSRGIKISPGTLPSICLPPQRAQRSSSPILLTKSRPKRHG